MLKVQPRSLAVSALPSALRIAWRSHRPAFAGQAAAAIVAGLAAPTAAWLVRSIIDDLASGHDHRSAISLAVGLCAVGAVAAVIPRFSGYLMAQSTRAVQEDVTAELFTAVGRHAGLRSLEEPQFQNYLRQAQQAGTSGPGMVLATGITVTQSLLTLLGFLLALAALSPVLAAVLVASAIPVLFLERRAAQRQAAVLRETTHAQRRQQFYANLLLAGNAAKEIRLFGLGVFFRNRMLAELGDIQQAQAHADRRVLAADSALAVTGAAVTAGGTIWAVAAAANGRLSVGDLTLLVAALAAASGSLAAIVYTAANGYRGLLMFSSYLNVLTSPPDLPIAAQPARLPALERGIVLDDVWFRYGPDTPWILRGVSCVIPHGRAVALVGHNGAGKSTLVKLLCRFYDPDRGQIRWDGVDFRDVDPADLRDKISCVFQDYMTYDLSAAENIAVGDLLAGRNPGAVQAAAQQAGMHETLARLPKGYQTLLTRTYFGQEDKENPETGVLLSGGQWQRVALARAFLRGGRDLMIMDEPSAGLDAEAEYELHLQLALSRRGRTTVLISHRLSTVRDADNIVVLSDGLVSEQGSHDALMQRGGTYARLFSLQARGYATGHVPVGAVND